MLRLFADSVFIGVLLFGSAGTLSWWRAWVLVATLQVVRTVTAVMVYRVNPTLLQERAKLPMRSEQSRSDKLLLLAVLSTGFAGLPVVAAFDVFRWHLLPRPSPFMANVGIVLFIAGWAIKGLALAANAFAIAEVRLQPERGHAVVDAGAYRIVRHPFYAGTVLVLVGLCLWLESYAAALLAVVPITLVMLRLVSEEQFLRRELRGYDEYAARVRHRLVPGIW